VTAELLSLRGQGVFQPYRAPSWAGGTPAADGVGKTSTDRGAWNVYYLQLHDAAEFTDENSRRCPATVALLRDAIPAGRGYGEQASDLDSQS
jgi:aspartate beta-hydroxylase